MAIFNPYNQNLSHYKPNIISTYRYYLIHYFIFILKSLYLQQSISHSFYLYLLCKDVRLYISYFGTLTYFIYKQETSNIVSRGTYLNNVHTLYIYYLTLTTFILTYI